MSTEGYYVIVNVAVKHQGSTARQESPDHRERGIGVDEFALSIHVRSTDPNAVAEALREMHRLLEYEPAEGDIEMQELFTPMPRRQGIRISKAHDGWVSVLVSGGAICANILARALSKWLETEVVEIERAGDDFCAFLLIDNGEIVDQYRLAPVEEADLGEDDIWPDPEDAGDEPPFPGLLGMHLDLDQLQTDAISLMTPKVQRIFERVSEGTATPADDRALEQWVAEHIDELTELLMAPVHDAIPEIKWVEEVLGIPVDDDDDEPEFEDEAEDMDDEVEDEDREDEYVIDIQDFLGLNDYLSYLEPLLASGVDLVDVDELLTRESIAPHELLPAFLPMLGIALIYSRLDYALVHDLPERELAEAGVEFVEHLKFQLSEET